MPKSKKNARAAAWGSAVVPILIILFQTYAPPNNVGLVVLLILLAVFLFLAIHEYGWVERGHNSLTKVVRGFIAVLVVTGVSTTIGFVLWPTSIPNVLAAELAPFVISYLERYKVPGGEAKGMRYGLAVILRIRTSPPTHVRRLDVVGDVSISCAEYEMAFIKDGELLGSYGEECVGCKPFRHISWVAWPLPQAVGQTLQGEQFVKFVIKEPENLGMRLIGGGASLSDYIGCKSENRRPRFLTTVTKLEDLVYFTAMSAAVSGSEIKRLLGPRLKKGVEDGSVQFRVELGSQSVTIEPTAIHRIRVVSPREWDTAVHQKLFYATDRWNRVAPVTKDPVMEPEKSTRQ